MSKGSFFFFLRARVKGIGRFREDALVDLLAARPQTGLCAGGFHENEDEEALSTPSSLFSLAFSNVLSVLCS